VHRETLPVRLLADDDGEGCSEVVSAVLVSSCLWLIVNAITYLNRFASGGLSVRLLLSDGCSSSLLEASLDIVAAGDNGLLLSLRRRKAAFEVKAVI